MCDLVSDHHSDAPEIQGLRLVLAEEGWLEDPCWKDCPRRVTKMSCECARVCQAQVGPAI